MQEMVVVRSAAQYFDEYAWEKIHKHGMDRIFVKQQMVKAFHKEIFGLVEMRSKKHFRGKIPEEGNQEAMEIARKVIRDETKKWAAVIRMFEEYQETSGLLSMEDLKIDVEEKAEDDPDIPEDAVMTDPTTMKPIAVNGGVKVIEEEPIREEDKNDEKEDNIAGIDGYSEVSHTS